MKGSSSFAAAGAFENFDGAAADGSVADGAAADGAVADGAAAGACVGVVGSFSLSVGFFF